MSSASPSIDSAPPQEASLARRLLPKLIVSLLLGALFAWLVARGGVPLVPPASAFRAVIWWTLPAYLVVLFATTWVRASRWRFLVAPIKDVPLRTVIGLNWIGFFAIFVMPLRLGELARPALSKMREGIPISVGFGTVAVERVLDGLVTSLCVAFAVFAMPHLRTEDQLAKHVPAYGILALTVFSGAFIALALFLWQRKLATALVEKTVGLVSKKLATVLASKIDGVADGIRSIGNPRLGAGFLAETLLYWTLNAAGMWLLAWGCGLPMSFGHAVAIMGILAIGILLPAGPGLFGNFQLAVMAALKLYFPEDIVATQGAVYIFFLYGLQALFICVAGIVPLYAMKIRFGDLMSTK